MWVKLSILCWFMAYIHGESSIVFNEEEELRKLNSSCLMPEDFEKIAGEYLRYMTAMHLVHPVLKCSLSIIGLQEARSVLGFGPLPPWTLYNRTNPSEEKLTAAPTVEAYYNLIEPRDEKRSLDSTTLFERNTIPAIEFLDEKFPAIREIFRRRFLTILQKNGAEVNRKIVDLVLENYQETYNIIRETQLRMLENTDVCWYGEIRTTTPAPTTTAAPVKIPPLPAFNETEELEKIDDSCMNRTDYEELTGNITKYGSIGHWFPNYLINESVVMIGLSEMRSVLGFEPLPPWKAYNKTAPSEDELVEARTVEAYYKLKEPHSWRRSLNSTVLHEKNMFPAIAFLEKRHPAIRTMFRRRFESILVKNPGVVDRKMVDWCLDEYTVIHSRVANAATRMEHNKAKCFR